MQGTWSLYVPCESSDDSALSVKWSLCAENGATQCERAEGPGLKVEETRTIQGRRFVRIALACPQDLPLGYYSVTAHAKGGGTNTEAMFRLIVAPDRCYIPDELQQGVRWWGVALQLYSLRSHHNWGVGDFRDLGAVIEWAGKRLGAAVIGLNPLHALKNAKPYHMSPYSPTSRLFLNDLYIDVTQVPECWTGPDVQRRLADPSVRSRIDAARRCEFVDYDAVRLVKREVLELCYQVFVRDNFEGVEPELKPMTDRGRHFQHFTEREGRIPGVLCSVSSSGRRTAVCPTGFSCLGGLAGILSNSNVGGRGGISASADVAGTIFPISAMAGRGPVACGGEEDARGRYADRLVP